VRRAARQAIQAEAVMTPVTRAPGQAMRPGTQAPAPAFPEAEQRLTEALQEYQRARQEWQIRRQTRQGWMPQDRTTIMVQMARRLEHTRQRLAALDLRRGSLCAVSPAR